MLLKFTIVWAVVAAVALGCGAGSGTGTNGGASGGGNDSGPAGGNIGDGSVPENDVRLGCSAPDDCPPADVRIITPVDGAIVCGVYSVEVAVTDDHPPIDRVEVSVDSETIGIVHQSPYVVQWDTAASANGEFRIEAVAYDSVGQSASTSVVVSVRNGDVRNCNSPPNISWVFPSQGAYVAGIVQLEVEASDDDFVTQIEFVVNNRRIGTDDTGSLRFEWDTNLFDEGAATLKAVATDNEGQTASAQISVTIDRTQPDVAFVVPTDGDSFGETLPFQLVVTDSFKTDRVLVSLHDIAGMAVPGASSVEVRQPSTSGELDTSAIEEGAYTLHADAFDAAGNTSSTDVALFRLPPCIATEEVCDNLDNDCDGSVDEGLLNACGSCGATPREICDTLDNDCNGIVDDGLRMCNGSCQIPPEAPCNQVDDDCNGLIDDAPLPEGGCGGCIPAEIACDGLDEDCDGTADDGLQGCGEEPDALLPPPRDMLVEPDFPLEPDFRPIVDAFIPDVPDPAGDAGFQVDFGVPDGPACDPRLRAAACDPGSFCAHTAGRPDFVGRCVQGDGCNPVDPRTCPEVDRPYCHLQGGATFCTRVGVGREGDDCVGRDGEPNPCGEGFVCTFSVCRVACNPDAADCDRNFRCESYEGATGERFGICQPPECDWFTGRGCQAGEKCSYVVGGDNQVVGACTPLNGPGNQADSLCAFNPGGGDNCGVGLICVGPPNGDRHCKIMCDTGGYQGPCPDGQRCEEALSTAAGPVRGLGVCIANL